MIKITPDNIAKWANETRSAASLVTNKQDIDAINWDYIDAHSIVFEVGSFKGRWALQMARKYNPMLYCFEPQMWAYETTKEALRGYNAQVFNYALGTENVMVPMGQYGNDGCSIVNADGVRGIGEIRDIFEVLKELEIDYIDLMLVNVEGYEYELIPYMFARGIFPDALMVQFHGSELDYLHLVDRIESNYNRRKFDYGKTLIGWMR